MTFVPEQLHKLAELYEQRNALYGDNYKRFGSIMTVLFPEGLTLQSADDWNRIGIFVQKMAKVTRYAANFRNGGHVDSLDDLSVYAQMLQELDAEIRGAENIPFETPKKQEEDRTDLSRLYAMAHKPLKAE